MFLAVLDSFPAPELVVTTAAAALARVPRLPRVVWEVLVPHPHRRQLVLHLQRQTLAAQSLELWEILLPDLLDQRLLHPDNFHVGILVIWDTGLFIESVYTFIQRAFYYLLLCIILFYLVNCRPIIILLNLILFACNFVL